ncbi:hypothetical protein D9758_001528 [Tetrapyrgos nigripes]|uniref:L-dopachrome isomerase n=1 Tax=Tetrapyrgos nigripes TaxID=182062 RepID=A0A8H5GXS5_9AGAR|nr:hypothetical protein D9758_001528 [Tetrapyrgos nigripes]
MNRQEIVKIRRIHSKMDLTQYTIKAGHSRAKKPTNSLPHLSSSIQLSLIMPMIRLSTNIKLIDYSLTDPNLQEWAKNFSKFSATTLEYPEEVISVLVTQNETLTFKGTFDPAFLLTVSSPTSNPENNLKWSAAYFDHMKQTLGIADDRGFISFESPGKPYIGYKSTTLEELFKQK